MTAAEQAIIRERRIKLAFFLLSLVLLLIFILKVSNMLVSTILAISVYYLLAPMVDALERRGFSRLMATTVPFLSLTTVIVGGAVIFAPSMWDQIKSLQQNTEKYSGALTGLMDQIQASFGALFPGEFNLRDSLEPMIKEYSVQMFSNLPDILSQLGTVIFLVPFFSYFLLLDGRDLIRKWLNLVPNNIFELALNLNHQIGLQIGGFIRARLIQTAFVGMFVWIGLVLIQFPFALVLGIVAGILNIIPYVGPVIAAAPALLIALANGGSMQDVLILVSIYVLSQILDAVILVPFLVARIVNLHPVTVILAVIIGAQVMGILGMIICIPVVSALKVTAAAVYKHITDFRT